MNSDEREDGWSTWDWFKAGCVLGALYAMFRNPQGVGCCLGCLGLLAVLAFLLVVVAIYSYWQVAFLVVIVVVVWRWVIPAIRGAPPRE